MKWWRVFRGQKGEGQRRAAERFDYRAKLSAKCSSWPKFIDLFTGDVSESGLYVPTDHSAEIDEVVDLTLGLPDGESVDLTGRVVRVIDAELAAKFGKGAGLGIRLDAPTGAAKDVFERVLSAARAAAPRPSDDDTVAGEPVPRLPTVVPEMTGDEEELDIELATDDVLELIEDDPAPKGPPPIPPALEKPRINGPAVKRSSGPVVGVDLGTTFTSVAAAIDGKVTILERPGGPKSTPSVIAFPEEGGDYIIGVEARERAATDPGHTIVSPKRLLGRPFDEPEVQRFIGQAPYRTLPAPDGTVVIEMWGQQYAMAQLCSYILADARNLAEERLGERVTQCVVSVPISFEASRIEHLRRCGQLAGIEIVDVVDEPSAAALANRFDPNFGGTVGVYDFGGGTFDFSVVDVSEGDFRVLATAGDTWLGGDDFDLILAEAAANQFWRKHKVDLRNQALEFQRLLFACERAKRTLSTHERAVIDVPNVLRTAEGMVGLNLSLDRATLERAVQPVIQRSLDTCDEALELVGLKPTDLTCVYLSGGTTYMPAVRKGLLAHFQVPVRTGVPPEHAVCLGAAIHGAQIQFKAAQTLESRG